MHFIQIKDQEKHYLVNLAQIVSVHKSDIALGSSDQWEGTLEIVTTKSKISIPFTSRSHSILENTQVTMYDKLFNAINRIGTVQEI